jgi:hypothetical protein
MPRQIQEHHGDLSQKGLLDHVLGQAVADSANRFSPG